jgi:hypothetical protein
MMPHRFTALCMMHRDVCESSSSIKDLQPYSLTAPVVSLTLTYVPMHFVEFKSESRSHHSISIMTHMVDRKSTQFSYLYLQISFCFYHGDNAYDRCHVHRYLAA